MKKIKIILPLLLLMIIYCVAVAWFGLNFFSYATQSDNLTVDNQQQQQYRLGDSVELDISGTGFDRNLQASLHMDVNNKNAIIGSFPIEGIINDMHKTGNTLFLANTRGLQQLDVSDPLSPQIRMTHLPNSTVLDIEQQGEFFYLSCGARGLRIYQLSEKDRRMRYAGVINTKTAALTSAFADGFLYISGKAGVQIYDLSNPGNRQEIGKISTGNLVTRVILYKDYLYLAARKKGVQIYRLQKSGLPMYVGHLPVANSAEDVAVDTGLLYVIDKDRISIFDLASPAKPDLLEDIMHLGFPRKIYFHETVAYISDSHAGVKVVPLKLIADAAPAGYVNMDGDPRSMLRVADYLYVAISRKGLVILDPTKVVSRQVVESINTPGRVSGVYARGHWLYIADSSGVFQTDLHQEKGTLRQLSSSPGKSLIVSGNRLFVAKGSSGIEVFDVQDPATPELIVHWPDLPSSLSLAVSGSFLVSARGSKGLSVFNISDLNQPLLTESIQGEHIPSVRVLGDLVFAATHKNGVQLFRISSDGKLTFVSRILAPYPMDNFSESFDIQMYEGLAYVANGRGGLLIADVQDPQRPTILSTLQLPGITTTIWVEGDRVFTANRFGGFQVIDVSSPQKPQLLDRIDIYGLTQGLQVFDGKIYLANGYMGVTAIPVPQSAERVDLISSERIKVRLPSPNFPGRYSVQLGNGSRQVTLGGVLKYGELGQKL